MNRLDLIARIEEISPLRYTPAGMPVVEFLLAHESDIEESGVLRKVKLNLRSMSIGLLAEKLVHQPLQTHLMFSGFLAAGSKSKSVVFHIHSFQIVS